MKFHRRCRNQEVLPPRLLFSRAQCEQRGLRQDIQSAMGSVFVVSITHWYPLQVAATAAMAADDTRTVI